MEPHRAPKLVRIYAKKCQSHQRPRDYTILKQAGASAFPQFGGEWGGGGSSRHRNTNIALKEGLTSGQAYTSRVGSDNATDVNVVAVVTRNIFTILHANLHKGHYGPDDCGQAGGGRGC